MLILERRNDTQADVPSSQPRPRDGEAPGILASLPIPPIPPITMAKAIVVSVAVCTMVITFGIALAMWVSTGELLQGLGLGLFCAFWGGPGFGLMGGGAVHALSQERAARVDVERRALAPDPVPVAAPAGAPTTATARL